MKIGELLITSLVLVGILHGVAMESDLIEDEDGLLTEERHGWKRCRRTSDCDVGYYCRGRWCYPRHSCNANYHCPSGQYCDTTDNVCKPGQRVCRSHNECGYSMYCKNGTCTVKECNGYRRCKYGYQCENPGICKLRKGFCEDQSHCKSAECCLRYYGKHYAGFCKRHPRPNDWCDIRGRRTCPCVKGYTCTKRRWHWGRCTPEPTEEPGSGDIESL